MNLKNNIIKEFSSELTQKIYTEKAMTGLWKSEKILIEKYFTKGSSVLDIGCGTGRTTIPLIRLGYKVMGVDITPAMISNAKKIAKKLRLKIAYEVGDATKLRFNDEKFDNAIFSCQGCTQIPGNLNRIAAIKEINRVLKRGGIFIFTTHVRTITGFKIFWAKQWFKLYIAKPLGFKVDEMDFGDRFFDRDSTGGRHHQRQYIHIPHPEDIVKLAKKGGFNVIYMARASAIDNEAISNSPMFYVCRKIK
jgi:ubiquinone/menaquinone biosynthesis C-methylase UbiE